jgi:hypothetical protein
MKKAIPFVLVLFLAGCVTRVETTGFPQPESSQPESPRFEAPKPETVVDKRVTIVPPLNNIIRLVRIKSIMGDDNFLKIQLNVQNLTSIPQTFSYRIDWLDENGTTLPITGTSLTWTLLSQETSFLAATAPTHEAKDFHVTFVGN